MFLFKENDQLSTKTYLQCQRQSNFFLLIVKNQFFYENQFFDSNSNELTIDQLQTILNNDHIRQHLIEVGYVSVLLL